MIPRFVRISRSAGFLLLTVLGSAWFLPPNVIAQKPTAAAASSSPKAVSNAPSPADALPGPTNVVTVFEQVLDVTGGNGNGDFVVKTPKSGKPSLTSLAAKGDAPGEGIRRSATAELTGSYDGASTFTANLNAYGSREDGFKTTANPANVLASSRAGFSFAVTQRAPYSITGSFDSIINLPTGNSAANASVQLVNTDTGVGVFGYEHSITTTGMPFNTSGTLDPGNYQLLGVANFSNVTNPGALSNGSASRNRLDFIFKVGQKTSVNSGAN